MEHARRLKVVRDLPWVIPARVLMCMTDEDLDNLAAASDIDAYWSTLNDIVTRIQGNVSAAARENIAER